jgi:two-component system, OmpR family, alkaline phosphatase synthesis response regulator PhoP
MRGMRVPLADDDPLLVTMLRRRLEASGYGVTTACDGADALAAIAAARPDAVILDAMMPRMTGYEVLRRTRADPRYRRMPILVLTALNHEASVVEALRHGADDFVAKPFMPEEVLARLDRLISLALDALGEPRC